jgi:hypothetical protein
MPDRELVFVCEICQTILDAHHCKAICPNCGRMLDCSDLPAMAANGRFDAEHGGLVIRPGSDPRDWLPRAEPADAAEPNTVANDAESGKDLP